jgi:hypothetical protein
MKTRPSTLADRFVATPLNKMLNPMNSGLIRLRNVAHHAQTKTKTAEKFVFDAEASQRVGTVLRDIPELLVEQIQFARAPFDLCWIEYDSDEIFKILNPEQHGPSDRTRDINVGLLIDQNRIVVVVEDDRGGVGVMPFVYHLNTEWPLVDQLRFCDLVRTSRLGIDMWLWGSVANKFRQEGKSDYLRILRDTTMVEPLFDTDKMAYVLDVSMGDFKNHLAILLLLNQPSTTQYVQVPQTRGWVGNKPKPFMAYRNVKMALDPVPNIVLLSQGHGVGDLRRRHRVRGHYCHNEVARQAARHHSCIHDWQAADDEWSVITYARPNIDIERWICGGCKGRRWWRAQHERGDASKGFVDHLTYEVTR